MISISTLVEDEVRTEIFYPKIQSITRGVFIEIGVFIAGNLIRVCDEIKKQNKDIKYIGIDTFDNFALSDASLAFAGIKCNHNYTPNDWYEICIKNIKEYKVDNIASLIISDSIEAAKRFDDNSIDLIFIDGLHESDYCYREILTWFPKAKSGGIICGHDWPALVATVKRAFNDIDNSYTLNITSTNGAYWIIKK